MNKENILRKKIYRAGSVIGTWSSISSPNVISVLGATDLDFVVIDMEHASMSFETVENMVRAAEASDIAPIIRVSSNDEQIILKALETGVRSIMVPHIETPEGAKKVVESCKYYPEGKRGLSPYTRLHNFTHTDIEGSLQSENKETLVGILVEGKIGLGNLKDIVKVKGVDLIYLGLFDICQSMGLPGQLDHPLVLKEIRRCCELIQDSGVIAGCMTTSVDNILVAKSLGYKFIAYLNDAASIKVHFDDVMKSILNQEK
jgi:4-hydroxy-2-oxoheptanedioate aldolase